MTSQPLLLLLLNLLETVVWSPVEGEVVGGDEGEVGWPELALELLTERERERHWSTGFSERGSGLKERDDGERELTERDERMKIKSIF